MQFQIPIIWAYKCIERNGHNSRDSGKFKFPSIYGLLQTLNIRGCFLNLWSWYWGRGPKILKVVMPILSCISVTFNWLTLTSDMHFVKFHPEVVSCLLSRGKRKYAPLGMRLLWKYLRNYFLVYQLTSHFFVMSPKTTKNLKLKFWICK